jgi:hypothetical protein
MNAHQPHGGRERWAIWVTACVTSLSVICGVLLVFSDQPAPALPAAHASAASRVVLGSSPRPCAPNAPCPSDPN